MVSSWPGSVSMITSRRSPAAKLVSGNSVLAASAVVVMRKLRLVVLDMVVSEDVTHAGGGRRLARGTALQREIVGRLVCPAPSGLAASVGAIAGRAGYAYGRHRGAHDDGPILQT
ncbi:hypothetical protein Bpla01_04160 [Burkholderia plantarii]|nr:hypothetical protein Bpla01_04160 [Burkholderia plantarii]